MPRNHHPAASTLRNRNRITNKTRLKIHHGSLDVDAVLIPDEDEEKHRLTNLVAGVDAEDANEHHLQEVLSAAHRASTNLRLSRDKPGLSPPSAYIPTPDSTGVVDNYEELYPPNKWKDPATYVATSQTVEESISNGIANGFTYYMDERDKEWLDRNNEEARGEGTSAQGAVSSASGTRTSARSAKARGKEPDTSQPVVVSEDEFELVMGVFEKVTHERTEYLHHGLETGMEFPAFSEYQDVFSAPLPTSMFATFVVPSWIPAQPALLKIAKAVYSYWKERRVERGGHRIIPTLNGDESDTLNESYICFRRRESKAVRKTRAQQVTSSDKLARLQIELNYPLELAKSILIRETLKKENAIQAQALWKKRQAFADLKRKFPSLNDKIDEELLVDKERPVKKPEVARVGGLKIRTDNQASTPRPEIIIRPKERVAMIREQIESQLARQKDIDHHWDDQIDNPYQTQPAPYACRLFKYVPPPGAPAWPSSSSDKTDEDGIPPSPPAPRQPRAVRMRYGRGGRIHLDRRDIIRPPIALRARRSALFDLEGDDMEVDDTPEEQERRRRLEERWKYDLDDVPPVGPEGADEQDRILVDDYDATYLRHSMTLHSDPDHLHLVTDPTLILTNSEGRQHAVLPYRLGMPTPMIRRDAQGVLRQVYPVPSNMAGMHPGGPQGHPHPLMAMQNGVPVAMQQIKKMQAPTAAPQMRISSNGGMRPPSVPAVANLQANGAVTQHPTPPHPLPVPVPQHSPPNGVNGISRAAISMPHVDVQKPEIPIATPAITANGIAAAAAVSQQPEANAEVAVNGVGVPVRPKSQNLTPQQQQQLLAMPANGFHLPQMAALVNQAYPHAQNGQHMGGLSLQQVQNLKSAFANVTEMTALQNATRASLQGSYMHVGPNAANMNMQNMQLQAGSNLNLKLPATRQLQQWGMASPMQRPASVVNPIVNGIDGQLNGAMNGQINGAGMVTASPVLGHSVPVRSPSANGTRPGMRNGVHVSMSPHLHNSPSPLPNIAQSQSPPRMPMTPNMGIASPSLQQQPVGGTQNGF